MTARHRLPGAALLHPLALAALVVLIANDHGLKRWMPGLLTGKLSDFAGVLLLPLFLQAVYEVGAARGGRTVNAAGSNRALRASLVLTALGFGAVELWGPCESLYRVGLGLLQWPFQAGLALFFGEGLPPLRPVRATADPTDLLALPMLLVSARLGRRAPLRSRSRSSAAVPAAASAVVALLLSPAVASAEAGAYTHDGFYLAGELGGGFAHLSSNASVSNGFRQPIRSSASGIAVPSFAVSIGATPGEGLVLGGRLGQTTLGQPTIDSRGERFEVAELELALQELGLFGSYYPDPGAGLNFGLGLALVTLEPELPGGGLDHQGFGASAEVGHGLWIGEKWTLGGTLRVRAAHLEGRDFGETTLFLGTLAASLIWH